MKTSHNTINYHFSFTLFITLLTTTTTTTSSFSTHEVQLSQLINFKNSLPNPSTLSNWAPYPTTTNPCSFTGITCTPQTNHVSSINLTGITLSTTFTLVSTHLLTLPYLQTLTLKLTNLSGSLPMLINCTTSLTFIDLSHNMLTGETDFSGCSNLHHLNISYNNFSETVPSFGDCSKLEFLDISGNQFSGDFSEKLSGCDSLLYLNVSSNKLSGSVSLLPRDIKFLYLAGNSFLGEIPARLAQLCSSLVELDLSSNNFSGTIRAGFSSCLGLESLVLNHNEFSGELPVEVLEKMRRLRRLSLSFNGFSGQLPESLSKMVSLEFLHLSSNKFEGSIPRGLCEDPMNSLKELYLEDNLLTGFIPPSLGNCSQLVALDLSFNYLKGTIPSSLGSLLNLRDLIIWFNLLNGEIPQELMYVKTLENLILDFNELSGEIPSGLSNCTKLNWISLSNNKLSGEIPAWIGRLSNLAILKLSNNSFSGRIPPQLGDCRSLIWLDLNTNYLSGPIPLELFKQSGKIVGNFMSGKTFVYIKNDGSKGFHGAGSLLEFVGIRPDQMNRISNRTSWNITRCYQGKLRPPTFYHNGSMLFLDVSHNMLSGNIPKEIGSMFYLYILNLGHNDISGNIPEELGNLKNIGILDLGSNRLEGQIPQSLTYLSLLTEIDLSNNLLSGPVPGSGQFLTFPASRFLNNSGLCGVNLTPCGENSGSITNVKHRKSHRKQVTVATNVVMGILSFLFCIFVFVIIAVETRRRRKKKEGVLDVYVDSCSHSGTANVGWKLTGTREALSINLETFENSLLKLTFADLLEATNGFHSDSIVGSGGFGVVYKAQLKDGSVVAIKKLIHVSGQGDREFTAEMETIGRIEHRNLVPLLGYCQVGEERLLVYEYMKYGSLDILHDQKKAGIKLDWAARKKIAVGAARGLAFLHHNCTPHIIHRDMKSSNVLLDENLEARVADFGMARLVNVMDTHLSVSTLAGTPGYVPPEYYQSFRCSTKGDVYSYGVVLLELLTGRKPTDSSDFGDDNLVGWVKQLAKLRKVDVFDPELRKEYPNPELELMQYLNVAFACLDYRPWKRPTMIQVMAMFKEIQVGSDIHSKSTIAAEDGGFGAVEMVDMSIKEATELSKV
ncbi:hypothetical protein TanjilG_14102 [Lupinus angustifolius]|uniref:non-specific serine/threonine protein kinase n=1 Tax=Lupinus angustifolius TaxID=3871 RepID=A0A1J7IRR7_LUPAN|nr:PREDICTED: protein BRASSINOSTEROID INSENSITIVE 1 [Lupinus angustifolius]OIW17856.1 hypothetical protein TanjilG_14102 [Lupinus angustifolius]